MFYRLFPDHSRQTIDLQHLFGGPTATACWIIGGGPSLKDLPIDLIARSPAPKFAMNLAGSGLLRPNLWTSYDPTARFQRSIYLDASILKFVHVCRAMDLIPETSFKVCEAPGVICFDRARLRGFAEFPNLSVNQLQKPPLQMPEPPREAITDWQDSFIQTIDVAYRLGFRRLYLAGCELSLSPPSTVVSLAEQYGVHYTQREPLAAFLQRCRAAGVPESALSAGELTNQYHFDEQKPFAAAVNTDEHYYRVSQYLRLSRRSLALAGLELISVTPDSRLNDYFPYLSVTDACSEIVKVTGDPSREITRGKYSLSTEPTRSEMMPMRDYRPLHWPDPRKPNPVAAPSRPADYPAGIPVEVG